VLALAGIGIAAVLGAFSGSDRAPIPPVHARRPAPPPPAADPAGTVRCSENACAQGARRVQAPIEDGRCGAGARAGTWARIDAGSPPLIACIPSADATADRAVAIAMPDVGGARLDRAEHYLDRIGVAHGTSGGGFLGILERDNWQVCTTTPAAGASVAPAAKVKLFVDRSC